MQLELISEFKEHSFSYIRIMCISLSLPLSVLSSAACAWCLSGNENTGNELLYMKQKLVENSTLTSKRRGD